VVSSTALSDDLAQQHLLGAACDVAFSTAFGRACDVSFEGEWSLCAPTSLAAALRTLPIAVVIHADECDDRGVSLAETVNADPRFAGTPVLAVGTRLGALDRWLLAAHGAFAVCVPSIGIDVLVAVINEAVTYSRSSRDEHERSHPRSQLSIVVDAHGQLPPEAFFVLIAAAWSGGTSLVRAADAIADAAADNGHDDCDIADIRRACEVPIPLVDVDVTVLADADRWYLYALAFWIALGPEGSVPRFSPSLQVLGFTLGVSPRMRNTVQSTVAAWRAEHSTSESFRRSTFRATMLTELEASATLSMLPPPPHVRPVTVAPDDDVLEMPDDAMIDDVG
jgi:hypothetical protein